MLTPVHAPAASSEESPIAAQSPFRGPLRALILDWAGTAIDFGSRAPVAALCQLFAQYGVALTEAQARGPMGTHKRDHIRTLTEDATIAAAFAAHHGHAPGPADVDAMYAALLPLTQQAARQTATLIPGLLSLQGEARARGLRIGSTTGYNAEMMADIVPLAQAQGYRPDSIVTVSDVPAGRPAPWMCFLNAQRLGIFPPAACVKIGDTRADIEEGHAAGMWTIALSRCGNEVGLSEAELSALPAPQQAACIAAARDRLAQSRPHFVVEGPADVIPLLDEINRRLARGSRP